MKGIQVHYVARGWLRSQDLPEEILTLPQSTAEYFWVPLSQVGNHGRSGGGTHTQVEPKVEAFSIDYPVAGKGGDKVPLGDVVGFPSA